MSELKTSNNRLSAAECTRAAKSLSPTTEAADDASRHVPRMIDGIPASRVIESLLRARGRVFLSGQRGTGKSTELRALRREPSVAAEFEIVDLSLHAVAGGLKGSCFLRLLILMAGALSKRLAALVLSDGKELSVEVGVSLAPVVEALAGPRWVQRASERSLSDHVLVVLQRLSQRIELGDARLDAGDQPVEISDAIGLLEELADFVEEHSGRRLLLVVDDGDKIDDPEAMADIFARHVRLLDGLRFSALFTFPYDFSFTGHYSRLAQCEPMFLRNFKVATRSAPTTPLDEAMAFFSSLCASRGVEPTWLTRDAMARAVVMSAGIPREFLATLSRAFLAPGGDGRALPVTLQDIDRSLDVTRHQFLTRILLDEHQVALQRVRVELRPASAASLALLREQVVVEFVNGDPWYDVHPVLRDSIDGRLIQQCRGLGIEVHDGFTWDERLEAGDFIRLSSYLLDAQKNLT